MAPTRETPATSWSDLVQPDRVHRDLYTDPGIFAREMSVIFGQTWVYLAHESQVPEPNSFVRAKLGLRPIIVTRDRKGGLHALFNRCAHRAATVCREDSGITKQFQCPYHGWTFRNTGELVGAPWPGGYGPDFDKSEFGLTAVTRVEAYRGFIFGTLNEDAPSLTEHLAGAVEWLDYWIDRAPSGQVHLRSGAHRMDYRGNWKLAFDNAGDGYHPAFSHRSLLDMAGRLGDSKDMAYFGKSPDEGSMTVRQLGNGHSVIDQRTNFAAPGDVWRNQRPQPGREWIEETLRERYPKDADDYLDLCAGSMINLTIFPNLLIIGNQVQVIEPLGVDRTELVWWASTVEGVPDVVNTMRMRTQEDFPAFGEPDDQANFEEAQIGLGIGEIEWILMNRGLDVEGWDGTDEHGRRLSPVTDELHMRGYYREWTRLMEGATR